MHQAGPTSITNAGAASLTRTLSSVDTRRLSYDTEMLPLPIPESNWAWVHSHIQEGGGTGKKCLGPHLRSKFSKIFGCQTSHQISQIVHDDMYNANPTVHCLWPVTWENSSKSWSHCWVSPTWFRFPDWELMISLTLARKGNFSFLRCCERSSRGTKSSMVLCSTANNSPNGHRCRNNRSNLSAAHYEYMYEDRSKSTRSSTHEYPTVLLIQKTSSWSQSACSAGSWLSTCVSWSLTLTTKNQ